MNREEEMLSAEVSADSLLGAVTSFLIEGAAPHLELCRIHLVRCRRLRTCSARSWPRRAGLVLQRGQAVARRMACALGVWAASWVGARLADRRVAGLLAVDAAVMCHETAKHSAVVSASWLGRAESFRSSSRAERSPSPGSRRTTFSVIRYNPSKKPRARRGLLLYCCNRMLAAARFHLPSPHTTTRLPAAHTGTP